MKIKFELQEAPKPRREKAPDAYIDGTGWLCVRSPGTQEAVARPFDGGEVAWGAGIGWGF